MVAVVLCAVFWAAAAVQLPRSKRGHRSPAEPETRPLHPRVALAWHQ